MDTLGLSVPDRRLYQQWLRQPRYQYVELSVLDLSGRHLTSIPATANTGQVNVDSSADVTRSCTLTFLDPDRSLQFDSDSPSDSALYFDRMVQVKISVHVPALGRRVSAIMFTGPLVKLDRTGDEVSVEAQGKESLGLHGCSTLTIKRGANAVGAIRTIMTERVGEAQFSLPSRSARLPKDVTVSWDPETSPWIVCKRIAASLGMQLYYDGSGVCRLRTLPTSPVYTFGSGIDGNITSLVQVSHDMTAIKNRVHVVGSTPAHAAAVVLTSGFAASPQRLAVNGVPQYYTQEYSSANIRSAASARSRAVELLRYHERMEYPTAFNAMPVPHLDERDLVRIVTEEYTGVERLEQFSMPLSGGDMSVGFTDLVSLPPRTVMK